MIHPVLQPQCNNNDQYKYFICTQNTSSYGKYKITIATILEINKNEVQMSITSSACSGKSLIDVHHGQNLDGSP